jgi:hypothetical protein
MLERLHEHIVHELGQSSRTDTIFVAVAVVFNFIVLGINSGSATSAKFSGSSSYNPAADIVLAVFVIMTILVNVIAIRALFIGRQTRGKLVNDLAATAIVVPLIIRVF